MAPKATLSTSICRATCLPHQVYRSRYLDLCTLGIPCETFSFSIISYDTLSNSIQQLHDFYHPTQLLIRSPFRNDWPLMNSYSTTLLGSPYNSEKFTREFDVTKGNETFRHSTT